MYSHVNKKTNGARKVCLALNSSSVYPSIVKPMLLNSLCFSMTYANQTELNLVLISAKKKLITTEWPENN